MTNWLTGCVLLCLPQKYHYLSEEWLTSIGFFIRSPIERKMGEGGRWDFVLSQMSVQVVWKDSKWWHVTHLEKLFSNATSLIFGFSKAGLCLNDNGNNWTIFCSLFNWIKGLLKHNPSLECNQVSSLNKYAVKSLISFYSKPLDLHYHNSSFSSSHFLF